MDRTPTLSFSTRATKPFRSIALPTGYGIWGSKFRLVLCNPGFPRYVLYPCFDSCPYRWLQRLGLLLFCCEWLSLFYWRANGRCSGFSCLFFSNTQPSNVSTHVLQNSMDVGFLDGYTSPGQVREGHTHGPRHWHCDWADCGNRKTTSPSYRM